MLDYQVSPYPFSTYFASLVAPVAPTTSWRLPLFLTLSLFLPGKYFSINLEPSYFVTQPIIFGDFIKVRLYLLIKLLDKFRKHLISVFNIYSHCSASNNPCRWVQIKTIVRMRIWQTWIRFRLFSRTTSMITTWPSPRRPSWFSSRMLSSTSPGVYMQTCTIELPDFF